MVENVAQTLWDKLQICSLSPNKKIKRNIQQLPALINGCSPSVRHPNIRLSCQKCTPIVVVLEDFLSQFPNNTGLKLVYDIRRRLQPHLAISEKQDKMFSLVADIIPLESKEGPQPVQKIHIRIPFNIGRNPELAYSFECCGSCSDFWKSQRRMVCKHIVHRKDVVNLILAAFRRGSPVDWTPVCDTHFEQNACYLFLQCFFSYGSEASSLLELSSRRCPDANEKPKISLSQLQIRESANPLFLSSGMPSPTTWSSSVPSLSKIQERKNPEMKLPLSSSAPVITSSHQSALRCSCLQLFSAAHDTAHNDMSAIATSWHASSESPFLMGNNAQDATLVACNLSNVHSKGLDKLIDIHDKPQHITLEKYSTEKHVKAKGVRSCKLFGFSLIQESDHMDDFDSDPISKGDVSSGDSHVTISCGVSWSSISESQKHIHNNSGDPHELLMSLKNSEQESIFKNVPTDQTPIPDSRRRLKKVHKQGTAVGRAIDLSKLYGYEELISELEHLFNMEGLLCDRDKGWQVAYTDSEGDMMLVGDDPWQEFCSIVCKILIYTKEELDKTTPGIFSKEILSSSQECSAACM